MKKRILLVLLVLVCAVTATACSTKASNSTATNLATTSSTVPKVINTAEYTLYQNIFYNNYASEYDGKKTDKRGVFSIIKDAYNDTTRYYVSGYLDQTMCCDWQWEFTVDDPSVLPPVGSLIEVSGVFMQDDAALDKYRINQATVKTVTTYTGATADLNMTVMTGTLERVQLLNYLGYPEVFEGQTVFAYGRIYDMSNIQDPYYDGSWYTRFETEDEVPAIGTSVVLRGVLRSGVIAEAKLEISNN